MARIDQYTGPYERWVYGDDLGRPFSFPAIRDRTSSYFTALMDSDKPLPKPRRLDFEAEPGDSSERVRLRYPPLWNHGDDALKIRPFCFFDPSAEQAAPDTWSDTIADLLEVVGDVIEGDAEADGETGAQARRSRRPRYRVNFPINPASWAQKYRPNRPVGGYAPRATVPKAIIAVIDDGLPFANRTFLDSANKSRVSHCWLQSARATAERSTVPFGLELSNGQIDELIATHGRDESTLYRASGAIDRDLPELGTYLERGTTHGAHIMSLAAGGPLAGTEEMSQDDIEIIAVQLPNTIAWDTSGFGKEMYMLSALHYIFERADRIGELAGTGILPLVINFSYGWSGGRHDGQSEMDAAIQELLERRRPLAPTYLVMPSGNTYLGDMHAQLDADDFKDDAVSIDWQVLPDDRTSSYVEFWLPEGLTDPENYTFEVTPPRGFTFDATPSLALRGDPQLPRGDDRAFHDLRVGAAAVGQMSVDKNRGSRWRAMLALAPTMPVRMPDGEAERWSPAGRWQLTLRRNADAEALPSDSYINVWVQRDDDPAELKTGGQQSYLVTHEVDVEPSVPKPYKTALPEYKHPLGVVRGFGSLNGVANAAMVTRVAGYVQSGGRPAGYSSAGGLCNGTGGPEPWGQGVDVCAVSDRSMTRPGSVGQGVRSGSRSILVGTSGASPQAARKMVRCLADGQDAFATMQPQAYDFKTENGDSDNVKNAHWRARLGDHKTPPLWGGS